MGQLRSGILNLQKVLLETEPKIKVVEDTLSSYGDRVSDLGRKCDQGYDVMYLYLIEKFKKTGTTPAAQGKKKLQEIMDPNIAGNIKGIQQWTADLKGQIAKLNAAQKESTEKLLATLKSAETQAVQLKALADKKKDKLFKSSKYKDKIKGYLAALDAVNGLLKKQAEGVKASQSLSFNDSWVDKNFKISPDMTVDNIKDRASMDLNTSLTLYEQNKTQINSQVRKWRDEYKSVPGQLAVMKKWIDDADGMEAEVH